MGELIEECAIREVEEECGIQELQIENKLIDTYHTYVLNNTKVLKKTYWFKMKTDFCGDLTPQMHEGITKVEWCNKQEVNKRLENSFANIKDVIHISDL